MFVSIICLQVNRCVYLAGERQRGGHLLHGQVADARSERASAGRTAAQLLAAGVADQVSRLALKDRWQDVVEAYRALEQCRELWRLPGQTGRRQGHSRGRGSRPRPGHRAYTGGCCSSCGRGGCCSGGSSGASRSPVLSSSRLSGTESSTSGPG